jgi:FMN phosphatase YigB (HAD superfamily)
MRVVLFDLGGTLINENTQEILPDAINTLSGIKNIIDSNGDPLILGLISNYGNIHMSNEEKIVNRNQYYNLLNKVHITQFFEPLDQKVTLSSEIGVEKPDERIFRAAIDKIQRELPYEQVFFITENHHHIKAVDSFGMIGIQYGNSDDNILKVDHLIDLIPLINQMVE